MLPQELCDRVLLVLPERLSRGIRRSCSTVPAGGARSTATAVWHKDQLERFACGLRDAWRNCRRRCRQKSSACDTVGPCCGQLRHGRIGWGAPHPSASQRGHAKPALAHSESVATATRYDDRTTRLRASPQPQLLLQGDDGIRHRSGRSCPCCSNGGCAGIRRQVGGQVAACHKVVVHIVCSLPHHVRLGVGRLCRASRGHRGNGPKWSPAAPSTHHANHKPLWGNAPEQAGAQGAASAAS